MRAVHTRDQADEIAAEIDDHAAAWATGASTPDWDAYLDRLEQDLQLDLGSDMSSPGIKRVLAIARRVRREALV